MERPIITLPVSVERLLTVDWAIDWRGQGSEANNAGNTQTVFNAFPRWIGAPARSLNRDEIGAWQAVADTAQGRVGMYLVRMCNPAAFAIANPSPNGIDFSNDEPFSTGFGWEYEPFALIVGATAAGATQMRVDMTPTPGAVPKMGQIMSFDQWPFRVTWVTSVSGAVYDIGVQMPLRVAMADGDQVKLNGEGLFEAVDDLAGQVGYGASLHTRAQVQFREVLNR